MAKTYEAMQRTEEESFSERYFLDLRNRKQLGDIEKKIRQYGKNNGSKIFNFTSAKRKEGVSTIIANLTAYFKLQNPDKRILVIDANFNAPNLHSLFHIDQTAGLSDVLADERSFEDIAIPFENTRISIVPSGQGFNLKNIHIDQGKLQTLLQSAAAQYEYIFIDSAPVLISSDALSTAILSDITFLVIESTKVHKDVALKTKALLLDNECILGGVILNKVRQVIPELVYRFT